MLDQFSRTELLIGKDGLDKLYKARVAVFGLGGVGGHAAEALVRSGIGAIDLIDNDKISVTNLNRQLLATQKTLGKYKVDVAEERLKEINPNVKITKQQIFYIPKNADMINFSQYDYIIDAIDTVVGKISLVEKSKEYNVPIICAMGAGNKMDPTKFEVADISKTSVCPLAKVMRQELKKRKIKKVKVVYSKEIPIKPDDTLLKSELKEGKHRIPGSNAFVPPVVGLIIAGEVIKDLINK